MKTRTATLAARVTAAAVLGALAAAAPGTAASASGTARCDGGRIVFMREGNGPPDKRRLARSVVVAGWTVDRLHV